MDTVRSASEITPAVDEALRRVIGAFLDKWRAKPGGTPPASGTAAPGVAAGAAASGGDSAPREDVAVSRRRKRGR